MTREVRIPRSDQPLLITANELAELVLWAAEEWGPVPREMAQRIGRRVALEHRRAHATIVEARPRGRALAEVVAG